MLKFVSGYLALSYLAFATLAVAGLLQVLAAWRSFVGFALLDYRPTPSWRRAFGPLLIATAYAWFFGTRRGILTPGPAGAELTILFGGGVLLALALTLLGAAVLHPYRSCPGPEALSAAIETHGVELDRGQQALLFASSGRKAPGPAICLLPDPARPAGHLYALAGGLAQEGLVVLLPSWGGGSQRHPDALALVSLAMAFLSRHPLVAGHRLAVGGVGLGGDLALQATARDPQIRAVCAFAPLLEEQNALGGLALLREMTYPEALAWRLGGRRRELLRELHVVEAPGQGAQQPVLVLYGSQDSIVPLSQARARLAAAGAQVHLVPGEGHLSLAESLQAIAIVSHWLAENLA